MKNVVSSSKQENNVFTLIKGNHFILLHTILRKVYIKLIHSFFTSTLSYRAEKYPEPSLETLGTYWKISSWIGYQSITEHYAFTFTHPYRSLHLSACFFFFTLGGKWGIWRKPVQMQEVHAQTFHTDSWVQDRTLESCIMHNTILTLFCFSLLQFTLNNLANIFTPRDLQVIQNTVQT